MSIWKHYHIATSIQDALQSLAQADDPSRLIAGGTDLLLDLQQGRHSPVDTLVDVTQVPELTCLEVRGKFIFVGAAVPLNVITSSPLILENALALATACGLVGGPQVRNTATLGGNVGHALPAGDGTIALLALDAQAEVANLGGMRRVPILELFRGPGKSILDPIKELISGFYLPLQNPGEGSAFSRVMRPQGVALPILNIAIWLRRSNKGIEDVRVAIGPAGPVPQRGYMAERVLIGMPFSEDICLQAAVALQQQVHFRTSPHRASAEYRTQLSLNLFNDVLLKAWQASHNL
jgi:CO/xanthine dehydrogenase FAD-binding subunit